MGLFLGKHPLSLNEIGSNIHELIEEYFKINYCNYSPKYRSFLDRYFSTLFDMDSVALIKASTLRDDIYFVSIDKKNNDRVSGINFDDIFYFPFSKPYSHVFR
jgi:hypothetical protein